MDLGVPLYRTWDWTGPPAPIRLGAGQGAPLPPHQTWDWTGPHPPPRPGTGQPPPRPGTRQGVSPHTRSGTRQRVPPADLAPDSGTPPPPHWTWHQTGGLPPPPPHQNSMNGMPWAVHHWRSRSRPFLLIIFLVYHIILLWKFCCNVCHL